MNIEDNNHVKLLIKEILSYCSCYGLLLQDGIKYTHIPFCLLPVPYPRQCFDKAIQYGPIFGKLIHNISMNPLWIIEKLKPTLDGDNFTKRLVDILETVMTANFNNKISFDILRSDYLINYGSGTHQLQQVEINTIASSFGALSNITCDMQRYIIERYHSELYSVFCNIYKGEDLKGSIPPNSSASKISGAIIRAHDLYIKKGYSMFSDCLMEPVIIFVIQENERNIADQRYLEYVIWKESKIKVYRKTLLEIYNETVLKGQTLFLRTNELIEYPISIAYFRAGYIPNDYPTEKEWIARKRMEMSTTITCPNISYHLAGCKKIQQVLTISNEIEKFISKQESEIIRECFVPEMIGLEIEYQGSEKWNDQKKKIINSCQNYVMKPQREGGGNNIYGSEIATKLNFTSEPSSDLSSYIIMSRIFPRQQPAIFVQNCQCALVDAISELGIYTASLFDGENEYLNEYCGYLLRTKNSNSDEGGIASGHATISAPILHD